MILEYNTGVADICLIRLPDKADFIKVSKTKDGEPYLSYDPMTNPIMGEWASIQLPEGNWSLLGDPFELTEEQYEIVVDTIPIEIPPSPSNDFSGDCDYGFVDYENQGEYAGWNSDAGYYRKAKESGLSLLRHLKIYKENPYGKEEPTDIPDLGAFTQARRQKWRLWKEAEKTTGQWILLVKPSEGVNT